jgi:hypothetical protein
MQSAFGLDRKTPTPAFQAEMAAFYDELLKLEVDRAFISLPYSNAAREQLINASTSTHKMFFAEIEDGNFDSLLNSYLNSKYTALEADRKEWDFGDAVSCRVVYDVYRYYCGAVGAKGPLKFNRFGVAVSNHTPTWPRTRRTVGGHQVWCYVVPRQTVPTLKAV